jgi:hypothetical protein
VNVPLVSRFCDDFIISLLTPPFHLQFGIPVGAVKIIFKCLALCRLKQKIHLFTFVRVVKPLYFFISIFALIVPT